MLPSASGGPLERASEEQEEDTRQFGPGLHQKSTLVAVVLLYMAFNLNLKPQPATTPEEEECHTTDRVQQGLLGVP